MHTQITSYIEKLRNNHYLHCLLIFILAFIIYGQTINFGLIDYDDGVYFSENPHLKDGLTYSNFIWSITYFLNSNWAPLTIWSYIADASIYGDWYGGYHLTNIVLHALNGIILFFIALRLSNKNFASLLLAVLFVVHPQHVESVAWLSQRKDLLSTFFMFLSVLSYISYKSNGVRSYYLFSIGTFMLGLMAKVIIAPLPVILLLIDYVFFSSKETANVYKAIKLNLKDKIPYVILALIFGGINYYAQYSTGVLGHSAAMPTDIRVTTIPLAYWFYPVKTFLPFNLIPFYPYPKDPAWLLSLFALVILLLVTVLIYKNRHKYQYLFFGWFFYLFFSTPMNSMFQTGGHAFADRYSYVASIGLFVMIIAILSRGVKFISSKSLAVFAVACVVGLIYLAYTQTSLWRDTYTLFSHALRVSNNNHVALIRVSNELYKNNDIEGAKQYLERAIDTNPLEASVYWTTARYYYKLNQFDDARKLLESALKYDVWQKGVIYRELAQIYSIQGDQESAIKYSTIAIEMQDELALSYLVRANAYRKNNEYREAFSDLHKAISINRQFTLAYIEIGDALLEVGQDKDALNFYMEALKQKPSHKSLKKRIAQLVEN